MENLYLSASLFYGKREDWFEVEQEVKGARRALVDTGDDSKTTTLKAVAHRARREIIKAGEGGEANAFGGDARQAGRRDLRSPTQMSLEDVDSLGITVGPEDDVMDEGSAPLGGRGGGVGGRGRGRGRNSKGRGSFEAAWHLSLAESEEEATTEAMARRGEERVKEKMASDRGGSNRSVPIEEVRIREGGSRVVGL